MNNKDRTWLTVSNAADYLGVSRDYIRDIIADGHVRYSKVRHTVFIKRADIDQLIEANLK